MIITVIKAKINPCFLFCGILLPPFWQNKKHMQNPIRRNQIYEHALYMCRVIFITSKNLSLFLDFVNYKEGTNLISILPTPPSISIIELPLP